MLAQAVQDAESGMGKGARATMKTKRSIRFRSIYHQYNNILLESTMLELESSSLTSTLEELCKRMSTWETSAPVPPEWVLAGLRIVGIFAGVEAAFEVCGEEILSASKTQMPGREKGE